MGMARNGGGKGGRPRVPLTRLHEEYQTASRKRRADIDRTWLRSIEALLEAILAEAPDGLTLPALRGRLIIKYAAELRIASYKPDGSPRMYPDEETMRQRQDAEFFKALRYGFARFIPGVPSDRSPDAIAAWDHRLFHIAYRDAWILRHLAGKGGDRPKQPNIMPATPGPHWTMEDYECQLTEEIRREPNIKANVAAFAAGGHTLVPDRRDITFYRETMDGKPSDPNEPPGRILPPRWLGPNRRPLHREITTDEDGRLRCRIVEMTVQEELDMSWKQGFTIFYGPYETKHISARDSWRALAKEKGFEHLLEGLSDEIITYTTNNDYNQETADREVKERTERQARQAQQKADAEASATTTAGESEPKGA